MRAPIYTPSHNQMYDVIIIGSGISGLACACILSKLGKKILILEQHDRPGGGLHTFREKGHTFQSGNHYLGTFDENSKKLVQICGSNVRACPGVVETFIVDGKRISYTPENFKDIFGDTQKIIKAAEAMYWVAFIKLTPLWLASLAYLFLRTFYWFAYTPYREYVKSEYLRMQEGDVGLQPCAMVGAAVTRHYMGGLSKLSPRFVYHACRTIRKRGGQIRLKERVSRILDNGLISNGRFIPAHQIISSIGALQTCAIARIPKVQISAQRIGQSVHHSFLFLITDIKTPPVVWIKEGEKYLFVSREGKSVHLISEMKHEEMRELFLKHFPGKIEWESTATKYSVKKYLGRFASYGLACSERRFKNFEDIRNLSPNTSMPNLYLTGQDILMPGIVSSLTTAMMTCRQVQGITLLDTLMKRDIMDRI